MPTLRSAALEFLSGRRVAVVGVSRRPDRAANAIYRKLRAEGYEVYAVNPNAETLEGDRAYPSLRAVPARLDGVVVVTRPEVAAAVARECADLGVPRLWMHGQPGSSVGSVSDEALEVCRAGGVAAIPGGCPRMFCARADLGHRVIGWFAGRREVPGA